MADSSTILKVLLFLTLSVYVSPADTHSLQFFYTAVKPIINVTAVGLLNGEQFVYYDSNIKKMIRKTEWIQKFSTDDKDYWDRETDRVKDNQDSVTTVMKSLNQAEGDHTLQWMFGCGLDNGTVRGYSQYRYDGEDFISLDLNWNQELGSGTWTAANEKSEIFINKWDPKGDQVRSWMDYLKYDCIDQLKKFMLHRRETLERKVHSEVSVIQKHSPSPELVCNVTGFFPKAVMIFWRKDGEDVHKDIELRMSLINQDGSFQKRSILKVPAEALQKHNYTCVIQHSSLKKELVLEVPKGRGRIGMIVAVLFVVVIVGVFIRKNIKCCGEEKP